MTAQDLGLGVGDERVEVGRGQHERSIQAGALGSVLRVIVNT